MKEHGGSKRRYKARKTPSSIYPATPPEMPPNTDVTYHAINESLLEGVTSQWKDQIVTSQILYKPGLLAMARIGFHGSRWEIHHERDVLKVIPFPPEPQMGDWENSLLETWDNHNTLSTSQGVSFYVYDASYDFSADRLEELQEQFIQFLISNQVLEVQFNPYLKMDKKLDETEESFLARCLEKARSQFDLEMRTLEETLQRLQNRLKEKLEREVRQIGQETLDLQSLGEGGASGKPEPAESRKRRGSQTENHQAEMAVQESIATIDDVNRELEELQPLREAKMKQFEEDLAAIAREREKDLLRINRTNVEILRFGMVWLPYTEYIIQETEQRSLRLIRSF